MQKIIKVKDLDFFYCEFQALKSIDVEMDRNEITALIGPSGCGKSTFLKCLNRMNDLVPGTKMSGSILIDGKEINDRNADVVELRKNVGMVFQRPNPFPLSIFENIAFGLRIQGENNKDKLGSAVKESLETVLLWDEVKDKLGRSALSLTLEQQQRLCIARLVAVKPEVLLMDEPCSTLDPIAISKIEELMRLLKEHYTIVIVTHNMRQAARVSEKTGFFLLGELIEFGLTAKVFTAPSDRRTEDYITGRYG